MKEGGYYSRHRSSAPCRIGYLFLPVYTGKRDLPTYPEPPSGRYGTYLPTYPARPAITTAVTSHVMSLHHFSTDSRRPTHCFFLARRRRRKKSDVGRLCARAVSDSPRSALTRTLFVRSLCVRSSDLAACDRLARTSIRPVTGERCLDYV